MTARMAIQHKFSTTRRAAKMTTGQNESRQRFTLTASLFERRGRDSSEPSPQALSQKQVTATTPVVVRTCVLSSVIVSDQGFSPVVICFVPLGQMIVPATIPRSVADASTLGGVSMTHRSDERLQPRNGHTLVVTIVARISGCARTRRN